MFKLLTNLTKAAVGVALTPVALAKDVVTLPARAMDDEHPFKSTKAMLENVGECVDEATKAED